MILPGVDDPALALAGGHLWELIKLYGWLKAEQARDIRYRSLVRYLHEHEHVRKIPRRLLKPNDQAKWKDECTACAVELVEHLNDPKCRVFFSAEAGFEEDPRSRLTWVKRGPRPEIGYPGELLCSKVIGAVEPQSGQFVSVIVPCSDRHVLQIFVCDGFRHTWRILGVHFSTIVAHGYRYAMRHRLNGTVRR